MLNLVVPFICPAFGLEILFLVKFCPKNQHFLFRMKVCSQTNLNMRNLMAMFICMFLVKFILMFICPVLYQQYSFLTNLVQEIQSSKILIISLIQIYLTILHKKQTYTQCKHLEKASTLMPKKFNSLLEYQQKWVF